MTLTQEQLDACIYLIFADRDEAMVKDDEAEDETERVKKAATLDGRAKMLEDESVNDGKCWEPRAMTKEDLAAAAVYRAKAEEARRNHERREQHDTVTKWIGTGDPDAVKCCNQWMEEDIEAMRLKDIDPTEDLSDWESRPRGTENSGNFCGSTTSVPGRTPVTYAWYSVPHANSAGLFGQSCGHQRGLGLDVYGIVAARDSLDHNRNIIFVRTRDNCQTIDKKNPCLSLTGPTCAVVVVDPVYFEVNLRVKGKTESEDKDLSYLAVCYCDSGSSESYAFKRVSTSKLSTVSLMLGDIVHSVEATISVRVVGGEWPKGCTGLISANTASIEAKKIELLVFGDDKLPVAADGRMHLSGRVVSVEADGKLRVCVMAISLEDQTVQRDSETFKAKKSSRSRRILEVHSCKLEVTIAWSFVPNVPHFHELAKSVSV
ncbi:hypothetical protein VPH35_006371 [Triticum aestivum]